MEKELKTFTETQLAKISPLEAHSLELKAEAEAQAVANDDDLASANSIKKAVNTHTKTVKEMRLDLTRPLDEVTKRLIAREREILAPAEEAKKLIGDNILRYEEAREAERRAEAERIEAITAEILGHYKPGMTRTQVEAAQARGKRYVTELPPKDAANREIGLALLQLSNRLSERLTDIEIEAERAKKVKLSQEEAARQDKARQEEAERRRQELEDADLEARKEAAKVEANRPKSNIAEVTEFEIEDEADVPRALCTPDPVKIRMAIRAGATEIAGIRIFKTKKVR